jgi:hypothetical protein
MAIAIDRPHVARTPSSFGSRHGRGRIICIMVCGVEHGPPASVALTALLLLAAQHFVKRETPQAAAGRTPRVRVSSVE